MLDMIFSVFKGLWTLARYPIYLFIIVISIFTFLVLLNVIYELIKGKRFKKGKHVRVKKRGILKRIFIDLPKQYTDDLFEKDPEFFKYQGLIIFEGRQRCWQNN